MTRKLPPAAQRPRVRVGGGDGPREALSAEQLRDRTKALCHLEFEKRWGEPFHKPGGARGVGTWLLELWGADVANKKLEDEARALYEKLQKRAARIAAEAAAFITRPQSYAGKNEIQDVPFGSGGLAAIALYNLAGLTSKIVPVSELEKWAQGIPGFDQMRSRTEGRAAFVARMVSEAKRFPLQTDVSNRDVAVAAILCEAGGQLDWASYEGWGTPARVIEDEETRVRGIRNALTAEPSPSGSPTQ